MRNPYQLAGRPRPHEPADALEQCKYGAWVGDRERRAWAAMHADDDAWAEPDAPSLGFPLTTERQRRIVAVLQDRPEYTLEEIARCADVSVSYAGAVRALWRSGLSYVQEAA